MLNDSRVAPRNNSAKKCNNNEKLKKIKRRLARKKEEEDGKNPESSYSYSSQKRVDVRACSEK